MNTQARSKRLSGPGEFARPPERGNPLLAVSPRGEERALHGDVQLSSELALELKRLATHPLREVRRLEREAAAGESSTTPAILVALTALAVWTFVAFVIAVAVLAAACSRNRGRPEDTRLRRTPRNDAVRIVRRQDRSPRACSPVWLAG